MTRTKALLIATLLVAAAALAPAGVAAQQDDESFFGGLVTDEGSDGFLNVPDIATTLSKWTSSGTRLYTSLTTDSGQAATYANETAQVFNANNETILAYANARLDASAEYDTFAVHFHDRAGGNATRYVVADVAGSNYTSAEMVASLPANRSVDYHIRADWYVSSHASDELQTFVDEYASEGQNLSTSYKAEMVAKYGGGLSSGLWTGNSTGESA